MCQGFVADDINGDGACVLMRKPDPAGSAKVSSKDPRIMVSREPHERGTGGTTYYRLWPEGHYRDYDGHTQKSAPGYNLDLNRMSPYQYAPEGMQSGAGSLPGMLPQGQAVYEARHSLSLSLSLSLSHTHTHTHTHAHTHTRARTHARTHAQALVARNNVTTLQSYHTSGRMILHSSSKVTGSDSRVFESLAKLGEKLTGYHQVSPPPPAFPPLTHTHTTHTHRLLGTTTWVRSIFTAAASAPGHTNIVRPDRHFLFPAYVFINKYECDVTQAASSLSRMNAGI